MAHKTFVDLVLDNGELVRIECNSKFEDELHEAISNSMKRKDWFSPGMFESCYAEYLGMRLDRVNMSRVVGTL